MKILANDGISQSGIDLLKKFGYQVFTKNIPQNELIDFIKTNNISVLLVRSATTARKDLVDSCNSIKIIGRGGVGMDNIDVNAIAPGPLNTKMLDEVIDAGPERVGEEFFEKALQQKASGGAGLERGAKLAVFLGSTASDGISGKLISALWDPWDDFNRYKDRLADSDIYTLRRIVPTDRGESW